jgi:hypothetical protein
MISDTTLIASETRLYFSEFSLKLETFRGKHTILNDKCAMYTGHVQLAFCSMDH